MAIKKIMLLIGLSVLFAGCSTIANDNMVANKPTQTGVRYLMGNGVAKDNAKAFHYFSQGAKENDPMAQNELAYMYAAGKGTPQNYEKALFWYQKAADQNVASAQYNLGLLYLHGLGTPKDKPSAKQWIKKAAAQGFEPAKNTLHRV